MNGLEVTPERDAFANKENKRFKKWYGEGSPDGTDAFEKNLGGELLWINPSFNLFPRVLDKIVRDKAHAVMIVPNWKKVYILLEGLGSGGCRSHGPKRGRHV